MSLMCPMSSSRWNQSHSCSAMGTRGRGKGGGGRRRHRHRRRLHRHRRRARRGEERGTAPIRAAPRPAALPPLPPAPLRPPARPRVADRWRAAGRSGREVRWGSSPRAISRLPPPSCSHRRQRGSHSVSLESGVGGGATAAPTAPWGAACPGLVAADTPWPRREPFPHRPSPHPARERRAGTPDKYVSLAEAAVGLQTIPSSCLLSLAVPDDRRSITPQNKWHPSTAEMEDGSVNGRVLPRGDEISTTRN